jgi:type II secretory pathway pseudopilin PulG
VLAPLIQRAGRSEAKRSRERGVTMALVAISMVAIISFAALAIDLGSLYEAKSEAQRSADAAALTAAQVISLSGITGDPSNGNANWSSICGPSGTATVAAQAVANQNLIGGKAPSTITVLYGPGGSVPGASDCGTLGSSFGINPTVSVYVQQASMPAFFAHVFGLVGGSGSNSGVSATAYAEAFNPSDSNSGAPTPVQPRCVKPIIVPNEDPRHPIGGCSGSSCFNFVNPSTGQIISQGMYSTNPNGVVGERFFLAPDCTPGQSTCTLPNGQPIASPPNLYYVPGAASGVTPVAIPTTEATCSNLDTSWAQDVAGCDQSTVYQCGVPVTESSNSVNLNENPATADTQNALQCLINQSASTVTVVSGQDTMGAYNPGVPPTYPFQILAGTSNPLVVSGGLSSGSQITDSSSIISLPIYDQTTATLTASGVTTVSIIGFLQVFVNATNSSNNAVDVTVLNVTGCGNTASTTTPVVQGTSPVPVRLITPP